MNTLHDFALIYPTSGISKIISKAKDDGSFLKAPNGEKSKLNGVQWAQVRTDNFKNWFGDWENDPENASKVVDENGEPTVVYHGTYINNKDKVGQFDTFKGISYFTDNKNTAFRCPTDPYTSYETFDEFVRENGLGESDVNNINEMYGSNWENGITAREDDPFTIWLGFDKNNVVTYEAFLNIKNPKVVTDAFSVDITYLGEDSSAVIDAKKKGQDGIIGTYGAKWFSQDFIKLKQGIKGDYAKENHYIIFDPNQIKSAAENTGEFSCTDNRIHL